MKKVYDEIPVLRKTGILNFNSYIRIHRTIAPPYKLPCKTKIVSRIILFLYRNCIFILTFFPWVYMEFRKSTAQKACLKRLKIVRLDVCIKTSECYRHFYRIHGQYQFLFLHLEKTHCLELFLASFFGSELEKFDIYPGHFLQAELFSHMPTPFTAS